MDYGLGAVFGCPAHDQRDLDFAKKYNLKVTPVVRPEKDKDFSINDKAFTDSGYLFNSKFLDNLKVPDESIHKTINYLEENNIGQRKTNYRLKDWGYLVKDIGDVQFQLHMMKIIIQLKFQKICCLFNYQKLIN